MHAMLWAHVVPAPHQVPLDALAWPDDRWTDRGPEAGAAVVVLRPVTERAAAPALTWFDRVIPWLTVTFAVALPLIEWSGVLVFVPSRTDRLMATPATAICLPLSLRNVWWALDGGTRPPSRWSAGVIAAVTLTTIWVVGTPWVVSLATVAVSTLIVLRPPWSVVLALAVVAVAFPIGLALDEPVSQSLYYARAVGWRTFTFAVLLWLVVAQRRLELARRQVADEAIVGERVRVEHELRDTVGASLAGLVRSGERTTELLAVDTPAARSALRELVSDSRLALADVRQLIAGYQSRSRQAELTNAASLLRAAGFTVTLRDRCRPDDVLDDASRRNLLGLVDDALRGPPGAALVIEAEQRGGRVLVRGRRLEAGADA